jgi:hypothetical protein
MTLACAPPLSEPYHRRIAGASFGWTAGRLEYELDGQADGGYFTGHFQLGATRKGNCTMGTGRKYRKLPAVRPVKKEREKRRRTKVQRARLVKLGMNPEEVAKMNPARVRELLKRPARIAAQAR